MSVDTWSFSRFNIAEHCLALFHLRYELPKEQRLPLLSSFARESGSAVHLCIERYIQELVASGLDQDLSLIALIVEDVFSNSREIRSAETYDDVFWTFRTFALNYRHNPAKYLGGEFRIARDLPETNIIVEAYPDFVELQYDEKGEIVVSEDWKTGYAKTVTNSNKIQGRIVSWINTENFPDIRVGYRINFSRQEVRDRIREFDRIESPRLEGRMRSIIARVDRAREEDAWPATPGDACTWCPIAANCRARNLLAENDVLVSDSASAARAASDYILLDAALKQRTDQLKRWTDDEGTVLINGVEVGYRHTVSGNKITNIESLITRLGTARIIALGKVADATDPDILTEENQNDIRRYGLLEAIERGLLAINGNKTKNKGVQNDPIFQGLWVSGDTSTKFGAFKPTPTESETE